MSYPKMSGNLIRSCMLAAALGMLSTTVQAQGPQMQNQQGRPPAQDGWSLNLGSGLLFSPTYVGDDDYQLRALPNVEVKYQDKFFASVQTGVGYNVLNTEYLRLGPIARVQFARRSEDDQPFVIGGDATTDLRGLGDVPTSLELGGFAEVTSGPWSMLVEARQAVNGHDGFVVDASAAYGGRWAYGQSSGRPGAAIIYSIGPRIRFVDDTYNSAYFSVNSDQSLASGLPVYEAGGGVQSYGVGASVVAPLGRRNRFSTVLVVGYDRLSGDAGNAPLVKQRGSRDQASAGVFFGYRF